MKNQVLFSSISKKLKCHLLQFLFGALRVKSLEINVLLGPLTVNVKRGTCQL